MKNIISAFLFVLSVVPFIQAQKIKIINGDLSSLKGHEQINVNYLYDELLVGKLTEHEYVTKKVREYNEKEPGTGDRFKASWESDKANRYHPKFEELINEYAPMKFGEFPDAELTLEMNITNLDPGYNIGISKKPAYLNCEIRILDKTGNELCKVTVDKAPGSNFSGYDFEVGMRVQECYAITGKRLGGMIKKACK